MKKTILVIMMVLACVASVFAGGKKEKAVSSDLDYVTGKGTLVVGITDFEPMDFRKGGDWVGVDADLAKAFAKTLGVKCEFIEIDWDSKTMELDNKTIDCVWNGMTLTPGVAAAMEVSKPYFNNAQIIVVNAARAAQIRSIDDVKSLKFAVESGSAGQDAASQYGLNSVEVATQQDAVMEVAAGTSDACIIDSLMAAAMVGPGTSYPTLVYTIPLTEEQYVVGFRKGSNLAAALNDFMKKSYDDGSFTATATLYGAQAAVIPQ